MPQVSVVLTQHFPTHGTNSRGGWTRHDFKDAAGLKYQTFDAALGNKAYGLLHKPVLVTYEDVARGDFTNRVIQAVEAVEGVSVAPVASQAPPTLGIVPSSGGDDRQVQIMRQSALERAIRTFDLPGYTTDQTLYDLADEYLDYFVKGNPGKAELPVREQQIVDELAEEFGDAA